MRGNCALSVRGIWHAFNRESLVMTPRPSGGRVAREAALLLWRWHHDDSRLGSTLCLISRIVRELLSRNPAHSTAVSGNEWKSRYFTDWASSDISVSSVHYSPYGESPHTVALHRASGYSLTFCQRAAIDRGDTTASEDHKTTQNAESLERRRFPEALCACQHSRRSRRRSTCSDLVAQLDCHCVPHGQSDRGAIVGSVVRYRLRPFDHSNPRGEHKNQERTAIPAAALCRDQDQGHGMAQARTCLGVASHAAVVFPQVPPNSENCEFRTTPQCEILALSSDQADGGHSRCSTTRYSRRSDALRTHQRANNYRTLYRSIVGGKIGDPSFVGVSEAGSYCLGSGNLGCLEVGRLARSPSWLRAVEGAAC